MFLCRSGHWVSWRYLSWHQVSNLAETNGTMILISRQDTASRSSYRKNWFPLHIDQSTEQYLGRYCTGISIPSDAIYTDPMCKLRV